MAGEIAVIKTIGGLISKAGEVMDYLEHAGEGASKRRYEADAKETDQALMDNLTRIFGPMTEGQVTQARTLMLENVPWLLRIVKEFKEEVEKGSTEEKVDALRNASLARLDPDVSTVASSLYFETISRLKEHEVLALLRLCEVDWVVVDLGNKNVKHWVQDTQAVIEEPLTDQWIEFVHAWSELHRLHPQLVMHSFADQYKILPRYEPTGFGRSVVHAMVRYQLA